MRESRPRCLVVSYRYPFPPLKGDQVRLANFLRQARRFFGGITVAYLEGPKAPSEAEGVRFVPLPAPSAPEVLRGWLGAPQRPFQTLLATSPEAMRWVAEASREHEVILVSTLRAAPLLQGTESRGALDLIDALSLNMQERAFASPIFLRPLLRLEGRLLYRYERKLLTLFAKAFVVSKRDWTHLGRHPKLKVIPNGVDLQHLDYAWRPTPSETLVFLGRMDYPPNVDAALFFAREVLPKIRSRRPGVRFSIVGANPHPKVKALAWEEGVEVTGFVPDIRPHLAQAAVFVAPLRWASGMQNKVLEAMAVGVPVVTTPKVLAGFEGMEPGRHLMVADTSEGLAEAVLNLLGDSQGALLLSQEARKLVETHYDWDRIGVRMCKELSTDPLSS